MIADDGQHLLFDCGPACVRRLLEAEVAITDIDHLVLTHLHYDHCVDLAYLVLTRWDQGVGKIGDLAIYGPPPAARMTTQLFGPDGVFGPDLAARTEHPGSHFVYERRGGVLPRLRPDPQVTEVAGGQRLEGRGWSLAVAEVVHTQPQLTCLAYRLEVDGTSVVFGGDTAPTPRLTELAAGADILVHMCHFLSDRVTDPRITGCCSGHLDAARTARDAGVRTLVLVHLTESVEATGVREQVIAEVGQVFDGQIVLGEDLLEVPVGAIEAQGVR